jgi:hypothetical protein
MYPGFILTFQRQSLILFRYQANSVADHYLTIGYLIPIMCILTVPVFPQARYFQNLLVTSVWIGPTTSDRIC